MNNFADLIHNTFIKSKSILVAGFDPELEKIPGCFQSGSTYKTLTDFYCQVIENIRGKVIAIKPQSAYFEALGLEGLKALAEVCRCINSAGIPLIMDVKRGDIGSTAAAYAKAYFGGFINADAITVNPFLGFDTLEPYLKYVKEGKGIFVLTKTSNPGSAAIQSLEKEGRSASRLIAEWTEQSKIVGQCGLSGIGAVVGGTYPEEAVEIRKYAPSAIFLAPGFGAQGASAQDVTAAYTKPASVIVNTSRALLSSFSDLKAPITKITDELQSKLAQANSQLNNAIAGR